MDEKPTPSVRKRRGHNEGSIHKRKDGRWGAAMTVNALKRKYFYGRTRAEAAAKLAAAVVELGKGQSPSTNERLALGQFLTDWLSDTAKPSVRPSTFRGYEGKVRTHILPDLGRIHLVKLTPRQVEVFLNEKRTAGLSPQTVQHLRAILRAALSDAVKWGLISRNVAALVDGPRVPHRDVQPLSPDEAKGLLEAAASHRLGALFSVALAVGLRQGEALGLGWNDIDLDAGTLSVRKTLQRVAGSFVFVEPKTARSRRTIALPVVAVNALRTRRARQIEESDWRLALYGRTWALSSRQRAGALCRVRTSREPFSNFLLEQGCGVNGSTTSDTVVRLCSWCKASIPGS
jgi:integrase